MAVPKINLNITSNAGYIKNNLIGIVEQLKKVQTEAGKKTVLNIEFKQIERLEKISKDIVEALGGLKDKAREVKRIFDDLDNPAKNLEKGITGADKEVQKLNTDIKDTKIILEELYSFANRYNSKEIKLPDFESEFKKFNQNKNSLRSLNKELYNKEFENFKLDLSHIDGKKNSRNYKQVLENYKKMPDTKLVVDSSEIPNQIKEAQEKLNPLRETVKIPVIIDSESIKGSVKNLVDVMPTVVNELTKTLTVPITFTKGNIDEVIKEIEGALNAIHKDKKGKSKNNNKIDIQIDLKKLRASLKSVKKILDDFYNTKKYFNPKIILDVSDFNKKLTNLRKRLSTLQNGKGATIKLKVSLTEANKSVKEFENKIKNGGLPLDKTVQIKADNSQLIKTVNESLAELNKLKDITVHINSNVKDVIAKEKAQNESKSQEKKGKKELTTEDKIGIIFGDKETPSKRLSLAKELRERISLGEIENKDNLDSRLTQRIYQLEQPHRSIGRKNLTPEQEMKEDREKLEQKEAKQRIKDEAKIREEADKAHNKAMEARNKTENIRLKIQQQYNEEVAKGNQLMEYGAMITQKQYDSHERKLKGLAKQYTNLGGDPSKLAQSDVLTLGTNATEVNRANAIKNAMSWQGMFFRGADEKVNYLTSSLNTLYTQLERSPGNKGVKKYVELTEAELKKARKEAEAVQKALDRMNPNKLRSEMGRHFRYIGRAFGFYESYDMLNEAGQTLMGIGEAMANLRTVMPQLHYLGKEPSEEDMINGHPTSEKQADKKMWEQQQKMIKIASQYGNKVEETIESARLWGRMYKDQETVNLLTEQSAKLAVADNFSVEESTKAVEAAMFQFGLTANTTSEALVYSNRIIDVYTKLSHNAGVTAQDLAAAVERSGSAAHQAGMDFEFLNALIAQATRSTALSGLTNTSPFMLETA